MATEIRNTGVDPLTLPSPLRGVLRGGQAIVLSTLTATLLAMVPSLVPSFLVLDLGASYAGSTDDSSYGPDPDASVARARAASTANLTLSGAQTIDGVSVVAGNVVLAKNQSTASQNGPYICRAGAWERSPLLPVGASAAGFQVLVEEGTVGADITFLCTNNVGSDIVGTSNLVFASGTVVDSLLVHLAGAETITGVKTFAGGADPVLAREVAHTITVATSTTADTVGGALTVKAGNGGATNANGGACTVDAGAKAGSGTDGVCNIGTTNAEAVNIGRTGKTATVNGSLEVLQVTSLVGGASAGIGGGQDCAILTVTSTTQGLLFPRMTEVQRDAIAAPLAGLVVYNTTTNKLNLRVAAGWEVITSA